MSLLRSLSSALPAIDARTIGEIEQEIVDELVFHIEMRTDDNMRSGMQPQEAREAAAIRFGDFGRIHRECRRTLLGERIMWQRIQMALSIVLLAAVVLLAVQMYSAQRSSETALAEITSTLKQMTQLAANGGSAIGNPPSNQNLANNWNADRPVVVETSPKDGDLDVDPALAEIRVKFSKQMADRTWSWVRMSKDSFPEHAGEVHYLDDGKTCVMPVKLESGKKYVVWLNSANYHNFKDSDGRPAEPFLLTFTTRKK